MQKGRQNTETHVHKITNVPVFSMVLELNDFDVGKSITLAIGWRGGGGGLKISTFWAQIALALLFAISGPKKSLDFQGSPLPMALVMMQLLSGAEHFGNVINVTWIIVLILNWCMNKRWSPNTGQWYNVWALLGKWGGGKG
jgi:hypothetical protein